MLRPEQRTKLDPTKDSDFYAFPRFVTHVDEGFIARLTALYREVGVVQKRGILGYKFSHCLTMT